MKKVYMSFSTDMLHYGHIQILEKSSELGELIVGILTDEVICQYKRPPLISFEQRCDLFRNLSMVSKIVKKDTLSYREIFEKYHPDIIVHGDDWQTGIKSKFRNEVITLLKQYGGELIEFPYTKDGNINVLEQAFSERYSIPEIRRGMLKKLLKVKKFVRVLEAHNGLTGLIVEQTKIETKDGRKEYDAMWISSLCDSASRGKPDIELIDWSSKINRINEIMEVTTKPIIVDGDTGGMVEHFVYNVQTLERIGVSAVIIEDKTGLKKNSLFGTEVQQTQDDVDNFCKKIELGKKALRTKDFMIIARIESLILEKGMKDAVERGRNYIQAGADGLLIHSRKKAPDEILEFCNIIKKEYPSIPIVAVPTTYNTVREEDLAEQGINIIIHANHLLRSAFPAMKKTAEGILNDGYSEKIAEKTCMPISEVISFIPVKGENETL